MRTIDRDKYISVSGGVELASAVFPNEWFFPMVTS